MLGSAGIKQGMKDGHIIIDPFTEEQLQPNSYDVTLGEWVIRRKIRVKGIHYSPIDLSDINDVRGLFHKPQKLDEYLMVGPYERLLCHTAEMIGTTDVFVPQLSTRSTPERIGFDICGSAGFGDVGFVNRWTMELQNFTTESLLIPVGARVGQMYFTRVDGGVEKKYESSYMKVNGKPWQPQDMLPKNITGASNRAWGVGGRYD